MKNAICSSGKALFIVLIVLVAAILLAAGAGFYLKKTDSGPQPAPQPVVTRHKIASVPAQPKDDMSVINLKPSDTSAPELAGDLKSEMEALVELPETDEADAAVQTDDNQATPSMTNNDEDTSAKPLVEQPVVAQKIAEVQTTDERPATPSDSSGGEDTMAKPVVEQTAMAPQIAEAQTKEEKEYFAIQVGAFRSNDNAKQKVAELLEKGYEGFIIEIGDTKSQPLYAVRFGHFVTKSQARTSLVAFKEKEKVPAFIMRSDQ